MPVDLMQNNGATTQRCHYFSQAASMKTSADIHTLVKKETPYQCEQSSSRTQEDFTTNNLTVEPAKALSCFALYVYVCKYIQVHV